MCRDWRQGRWGGGQQGCCCSEPESLALPLTSLALPCGRRFPKHVPPAPCLHTRECPCMLSSPCLGDSESFGITSQADPVSAPRHLASTRAAAPAQEQQTPRGPVTMSSLAPWTPGTCCRPGRPLGPWPLLSINIGVPRVKLTGIFKGHNG